MSYRVSIDTGGTFTDVVVADAAGRQVIGKALTTQSRIFDGMKEALSSAADELGFSLRQLLQQTTLIIYGTTQATNAIVTGKTAKTAFLTTAGFPDVLVLKEGGKHNPHDFTKDFPEPYIPRRYTYEINERTQADGSITTPLDETQALDVIRRLKRRRMEAVAVCFLWSIANAKHEMRMGELLADELPNVPFTLSHKLVPIVREYRRASATAIDASLKPLMSEHLRNLEADFRAVGYRNDVLVSTSVGGCMLAEELIDAPIHLVKSGPAMAPVAAVAYAAMEELGPDAIVCDAGGTTFDVVLVRDGRPVHNRDSWVGGRWTGHLLGVSSVDVRSIGAGGGSIAWLDEGGLLRVGPQSAGADPGPACYGRGGRDPTVSDAACVLNYLDPEFFLGGRMRLDVAAARQTINGLAQRIGLSLEEAAFSILTLAGELMMKAIQEITIAEGVDPSESVLVGGGGAAGLNILPIARELGCKRIILPRAAAALSASGMQYADIVKEETASLVTTSGRFDRDGVNRTLAALEEKLRRFVSSLGPQAEANHVVELFAEARYVAQIWELETPLPRTRFDSNYDVDELKDAFHKVHERVFEVRDEASEVECVNWKARLTVRVGASVKSGAKLGGGDTQSSPTATRLCYFGNQRAIATPVFRGSDLSPGARIAGPAVIEEPTTTVVVYPGMAALLSSSGNYVLDTG